MHSVNIEGIAEWSIPVSRFDPAKRDPGISAFVRVKDEADFILQSLDSITPLVDEVVIAVQGEQSDLTLELVAGWAESTDTDVQLYEYPFDSIPNGPGHIDQPRGSVYERAYFYNWTLSHTTKRYALKWDGDMVARPGLGQFFNQVVALGRETGWFYGIDWMQGEDGPEPCPVERTATEPRLFAVSPSTFYATGKFCEVPVFRNAPRVAMSEPGFDHYKWCKPFDSISKSWPEHWSEMEHFQRIIERKCPGYA